MKNIIKYLNIEKFDYIYLEYKDLREKYILIINNV